jgi:hypothetical protein
VRFAQVFPQVWHPLHAIASATTFGAESSSYICANMVYSPAESSSCVLRATGWPGTSE